MAGSNDGSWRGSLLTQFAAGNRLVEANLREIFLHLQHTGKLPPQVCNRCALHFPSAAQRLVCGHVICDTCLARCKTRYMYPRVREPELLEPALALRELVHVCKVCNRLNAVMVDRPYFDTEIVTFPPKLHVTGERRPRVLVAASQKLQANTRSYSYFENQRYIAFLGWSEKHLTAADVRGATSDENTDEIDVAEAFALPNSSWVWITDWHVDHQRGDADGWEYAPNWPGGILPGMVWLNTCGALCFVRQRRHVRLAFHLTDAMLALGESVVTHYVAASVSLASLFAVLCALILDERAAP